MSEFRVVASGKGLGIWTPENSKNLPDAERRIRGVFHKLLDRELCSITEDDLDGAMSTYRRKGLTGEGATANGQVARARSYLISILDWAAGRGRFVKIGAHRSPNISAPDARLVQDPSTQDPTITGQRERVLTEKELKRVLPFLTYPAPRIQNLQISPEKDFRFIALKCILLTLPRVANVEEAIWEDIDLDRGLWNKTTVKNTRGRQFVRSQTIHLSDGAIALLKSLPGSNLSNPKAHVFPNENGGKLGNWTRLQKALYEATKTNGWHRHDLRRTSSTILGQLSVDVGLVSRLLGQGSSKRESAAAVALKHYIMQKNIVTSIEAPAKVALDRLADVYALLEHEGNLEIRSTAA